MGDIDPGHFLEELRFDIQAKDMIKARLVMAHFAEMDAQTRRRALLELSRAPDSFVLTLLVGVLAAAPERQENVSTLKELLFSRALDSPRGVIQLLMRENNPAHRAVLAETAGQIKLEQAAPILLAILGDSQDEKVLRAALLALGMIGHASAVTPVSEYLYCGSAALITAAIQSLAMLGTPTAIQRLFEKLGADGDLDGMILDILATSQESEALVRLNALLSAKLARLRTAAKQRLIRVGRKAVPVLVNNLLYDNPDLRIHSLDLLGAIGDASAIAPIRKLLHGEPVDPNVRFAAYEALGYLPMAQGAFALAQGLEDPVHNVRAAAARAIDHNYSKVLAAGIKNLIRDEDPTARPVSRIFMDAECDRIVLDLMGDEIFRDFAVAYLGRRVHADTRSHFSTLFKANGYEAFAEAIQAAHRNGADGTLKVIAVDDSKMILNIYRSVLHNLGCSPVLFEFPADAIRRIGAEKPDLIFTDLNMPDISGVELTRAVRRQYSKERLPIIMVTTQNEGGDSAAALQAGVNAILHKPFNEDGLRTSMQEVLSNKQGDAHLAGHRSSSA